MRVISRRTLLSFAEKHKDAAVALEKWRKMAEKAKWQNPEDLKKQFAAVDIVGKFTVFDIKGNQYRLIVDIQYQKQIIFIKYVLTHKEYDRDKWKRDPYY